MATEVLKYLRIKISEGGEASYMAQPDSERVIQDLNRCFAAPLQEFYRRRIIFWYDEDKDFEEKVTNGEILLTNAKIVVLDGTNNFSIKKLLTHDDKTSNYCVYCPVMYPDEKNWLLPVQLYSEEYRADLISMWLDEMGIENTTNLRKIVKDYRSFFKTKAHRIKIARLNQTITAPVQLLKAIMAVLCGVKKTDPNLLIRTVLRAGLDQGKNGLYCSLVKFGMDKVFWQMVTQMSGYREEKPNLGELSCRVLLTAATRTMHIDNFVGLDSFISTPHQAYCYDFMSEWLHSDQTQELFNIARTVEEELNLSSRFSQLPVTELVDTELFPCIDECILKNLMGDIVNNTLDADKALTIIDRRRTFLWYKRVENYYIGVVQAANMQKFYLEHIAGFHIVEPHKIWNAYTGDYYRMDTYYRLFQNAFLKTLTISNDRLDDLFKQVADNIENLYANWYLDNLDTNWVTAAEDNLREYGHVLEVPQQRDFYRSHVEKVDTRVFVIVSDAMRYETAVTLANELRQETQAKVTMESCEGIFPTVTKFGMAALLPHKDLAAVMQTNGTIGILADGNPTDANYRDGILKAANSASVALQYKNIIKMKRAERSALVKGMEVVYIYHNCIDETSHTDEMKVFSSCDETIRELKNMVRIIVNEFGGTRIFITADHGFIYTARPLSEEAKIDKTTALSEEIEVDRRYLITKKGAKPDYLLPVKFLDGKDYDAFTPIGNRRIKKKGSGLYFVHGGISLQEIVVPIIDYHYMRSDSVEYRKNRNKYDTKPVTLSLLSATRKIGNMIFSLNFYQKEAVGPNREAATYLLYFTDSEGNQVSDTQRIIADCTGNDNQDRTFRISFNLKSMKYSNRERYYLIIADESNCQLPKREEFQIDIAFPVDKLNFFD